MRNNAWNYNLGPWLSLVRDMSHVMQSEPSILKDALKLDRELFQVPYDIEEIDDQYVLSFDVPGIAREDLNVEVTANQLTVSGERKATNKISSRRVGRFEKSFELPKGCNPASIEADYKDGVLKVSLKKPEASTTQKISIGDGTKQKGLFTSDSAEKKVGCSADEFVKFSEGRDSRLAN